MYFVGALIYLTFGGSWLQILVGRGAMAYSISEILLMPSLILHYKPKQMRILLYLTLFVIYTIILSHMYDIINIDNKLLMEDI